MKNADMPAMPSKAEISNTDEAFAYQCDHGSKFQFPGLTKREIFAMHAMQACRSRDSDYFSWQDLANDAVEIADALLAELEKKQ